MSLKISRNIPCHKGSSGPDKRTATNSGGMETDTQGSQEGNLESHHRRESHGSNERRHVKTRKGGDNMCQKHGTHKWATCLDNWRNQKKKGGAREREAHNTEAEAEPELFLHK